MMSQGATEPFAAARGATFGTASINCPISEAQEKSDLEIMCILKENRHLIHLYLSCKYVLEEAHQILYIYKIYVILVVISSAAE